jgi:hypothetical protein
MLTAVLFVVPVLLVALVSWVVVGFQVMQDITVVVKHNWTQQEGNAVVLSLVPVMLLVVVVLPKEQRVVRVVRVVMQAIQEQ